MGKDGGGSGAGGGLRVSVDVCSAVVIKTSLSTSAFKRKACVCVFFLNFLVVQWTRVPSLVWEESTCGLSLCPPLLKPLGPGDYAPEEEKPPLGSPRTPPREGPLLATARDGDEDPVPPEINKDIHFTTK